MAPKARVPVTSSDANATRSSRSRISSVRLRWKAMQLSGKKIALLVDNIYQEMEVWYPLFRLREAGAQVVTVGAKAGETYASKLGYPVHCDKSYDEVSAAEFDGVVIPGGYAPDHIRRHEAIYRPATHDGTDDPRPESHREAHLLAASLSLRSDGKRGLEDPRPQPGRETITHAADRCHRASHRR